MATTRYFRGECIRRELQWINRRSKCLFVEQEKDHNTDFKESLRERQHVFHAGLCNILQLFKTCRAVLAEWKKAVFQGDDAYCVKDEEVLKGLFETWHSAALRFRQRAEFYERHELPLDSSVMEDLKMYLDDSKRILEPWEKPCLSKAFALRTRKLNAEESEKLLALDEERKAQHGKGFP